MLSRHFEASVCYQLISLLFWFVVGSPSWQGGGGGIGCTFNGHWVQTKRKWERVQHPTVPVKEDPPISYILQPRPTLNTSNLLQCANWYQAFEILTLGLQEWLSIKEHWVLLYKTWVQFIAHTWKPSTVCNSSSGRFCAPFWCWGCFLQMVHRYTSRKNIKTHKMTLKNNLQVNILGSFSGIKFHQ